jgi:GAF domain-containing protein
MARRAGVDDPTNMCPVTPEHLRIRRSGGDRSAAAMSQSDTVVVNVPSNADALTSVEALQALGRIDLSAETSESFLLRVCELSKIVVPGAEEVSISLLRGGKATSPASTGPLATSLDEQQYELGHGPCLAAAEGGEVQCIVDSFTESRWPDYLARAVQAGLGSSLSIPVPVQAGVAAGLNMYSRTARSFTDQDADTAQRFASFAGVAFGNLQAVETNKQLADQLRTAMESRAVIEQAKGALMARRGCSAADAFDILVELSQSTNKKLRVVAQTVVDATREGQLSPN